METAVHFDSGGFELAGLLHVPPDLAPGQRRAAVVVLHGFGSNKDGGISMAASQLFASLGYITLRFDMRGCGQSQGPRGKVICLEQVADTQAALDFLQSRPEVDASRMGVMGHSFGGAVAIRVAVGLSEMVCGVVTFATQSAGCEIAGGLQSTPLLMFHGDSDSILPLEASEVVRAIAGTGDLRVMHGDDHLLVKSHDVMFSDTMEWLNAVFTGVAS